MWFIFRRLLEYNIINKIDLWTKLNTSTYCNINYIYSSYYQCPRCSYGTKSVGDSWTDELRWSYSTYDDNGEFYYATYDCADCQCSFGTFVIDFDYVYCAAFDSGERDINHCIRDYLLCQDGSGGNYDSEDTTTCSGEDETYCYWEKRVLEVGSDPDTVCIEQEYGLENQGLFF